MRHSKLRFPILAIVVVMLGATEATATSGGFSVLHAFTGRSDGSAPFGDLISDSAGNFYGTTGGGAGSGCGGSGCGSVFIVTANGAENVIYGFQGGADGQTPIAGLVSDGNGGFFGTTGFGGGSKCGPHHSGCGTVYAVNAQGNETIVYAFQGGRDGKEPEAGLFRDASGNLYGTTSVGGDKKCPHSNSGCGTVFELAPDGTKTILHTFKAGKDGSSPTGILVGDAAGNLYGTTGYGGRCRHPGCGTVFEISAQQEETVFYRFKGGSDGEVPVGGLAIDVSGDLYGTTSYGGGSGCGGDGCGTVFELLPNGHEKVLYAFQGGNDGRTPYAKLTIDSSGALFGTTNQGGGSSLCPNGCGTVFEVNTDHSEVILHSFSGGSDGAYPYAGLALDSSGDLFGSTLNGGDSDCNNGQGCGVVFELTGNWSRYKPRRIN